MRVTIHIEVGDYNKSTYKKEVLSWMHEHYPHLVTFDFDSHSDAGVMNYALDLVKQGEEIIVIIDQFPNGNSKPILKMIDSLTREKSKSILVIFNGEDSLIDKMLSVLSKEKVIKNIDIPTQKEKIRAFFRLQ